MSSKKKVVVSKPQPLKANCFRCCQNFTIKFVTTTSNYGQKNNWDYWTKDKEDKDKKICDPCLLDMYNNHKEEYLDNISDFRKRNLLRNYISDKVIKDKVNS
jgi:hypothetical protein